MDRGLWTFLLVVSLVTIQSVCNGLAMAPSSEDCRSTLSQNNESQTNMAPYGLSFNESCFKAGRGLQVTLAGVNESAFTGFLVQARKPNDSTVSYGTFNSEGDSRMTTIDCFNQSDSAIGNSNQTGGNFTRMTFEWTSPAVINVDLLEFVASVLLDSKTSGLRTPIARCNDSGDNSPFPLINNESESTAVAATSTAATTTVTHETPIKSMTTAIGNIITVTNGSESVTKETTLGAVTTTTNGTGSETTETPIAGLTTAIGNSKPAANGTMTTEAPTAEVTTAIGNSKPAANGTMTTEAPTAGVTTAIGNSTPATNGTMATETPIAGMTTAIGNSTPATNGTMATETPIAGMTTAIVNSTPTTNGTGFTLSTATATSVGNRSAITTTTKTVLTTSGADRLKDSTLSFALSVAFVASLPSVRRHLLTPQ